MLPFKTKFGWGIGTLTVSLMFQANGLLLLVYLTDYVNMQAATAGLLIGLSKIYDALTDPVMGRITDRTNTRWGKRRPYVFIGTLLCALSFLFLFNLALFSESENIILITLFALILKHSENNLKSFNLYLYLYICPGLKTKENQIMIDTEKKQIVRILNPAQRSKC